MRSLALLLSLGLLSACAARPPASSGVASRLGPSVDIEALLHRGCYVCLEAAFAAAASAGAGPQAFEVALLLASRSKELGLQPEGWLAQAHALLPPGPDWAMYLDIVENQHRDPASDDRDVLLAEDFARRLSLDAYADWRERLRAGPGSAIFRTYLNLTITCRRQQSGGRDEATEAALARFGSAPLIQYRAGLCGGDTAAQLAAAREAEASLVDADLELGRRALQDRVTPDIVEGLGRLRSARQAFPASPVVPTALGDLHRRREEWPEALAEYDAVLALVPTHRDALLGRTISLSHLIRHDEAVRAATRLIELDNWFLGEAHYWRAWNLYHQEQIQAARADADQAKTRLRSAPVLVLSGMIEWREKRLGPAEREFEEALNIDFGQCEAASFLGGVRAELHRWRESLAAFQHARQCFELSIVTRRALIAELSATPAGGELNARQIASQQEAIHEAETRREEAARNIGSIQALPQLQP